MIITLENNKLDYVKEKETVIRFRNFPLRNEMLYTVSLFLYMDLLSNNIQ